MSFIDNLRKALGKIAGDVETQSGAVIKDGGKPSFNESHGMISVPFTYKEKGKTKSGVMYMSGAESGKYNSAKSMLNSSNSIYGAELFGEGGMNQSLDFEGTKKFLNKLDRENDFTYHPNFIQNRGNVSTSKDPMSFYNYLRKYRTLGSYDPNFFRQNTKYGENPIIKKDRENQ